MFVRNRPLDALGCPELLRQQHRLHEAALRRLQPVEVRPAGEVVGVEDYLVRASLSYAFDEHTQLRPQEVNFHSCDSVNENRHKQTED